MESLYLDCQCSDMNHTVRFSLDDVDGDIYVEVRLNRWKPWYKRLLDGIKHVLNINVPYGHYDTTMLRDEDYVKLQQLLLRSTSIKVNSFANKGTGVTQEKPELVG